MTRIIADEETAKTNSIFELQRREDFYGVIVFLKNRPSDVLATIVPPHVSESDAAIMLRAAADDAGSQ